MANFPPVYPSSVEYRPGRVQSLTPEQEVLLKQSWAFLLRYWGYQVNLTIEDIQCKDSFVVSSIVRQSPSKKATPTLKTKKSFFSKKSTEKPAAVSAARAEAMKNAALEQYTPVEPSDFTRHVYYEYYKQGSVEGSVDADDTASVETFYTAVSTIETGATTDVATDVTTAPKATASHKVRTEKRLLPFMSKYDPHLLHSSLFEMVKNDLADNLVLRYIRARKHHLVDALKMFTNTLHWRKTGYPVEKWLREGDARAYFSGESAGFVKNFTTSKSFIRGHDKNNNPLFVFQSRKHFAADLPLPETERFALVTIEWCRLFLREVHESVDTCSLMFDLSGFSLKNADNAPVKFLTSMFDAHYPESLGIVIVHNAPWIFHTVWNVIKHWLDPVVLAKIHFTKGYDELREFIDPHCIPKYLGGEDDGDLSYHTPDEEHTEPPRCKDARYRQLQQERDELFLRFIEVTAKWAESTNAEVSSQLLRDKIYLSYQLLDNYIELDQYVRSPGVYDRNGSLVVSN